VSVDIDIDQSEILARQIRLFVEKDQRCHDGSTSPVALCEGLAVSLGRGSASPRRWFLQRCEEQRRTSFAVFSKWNDDLNIRL